MRDFWSITITKTPVTVKAPCGCTLTIYADSIDGNFIKGRVGDNLGGELTRCQVHDAGPRLLAALRMVLDDAEKYMEPETWDAAQAAIASTEPK